MFLLPHKFSGDQARCADKGFNLLFGTRVLRHLVIFPLLMVLAFICAPSFAQQTNKNEISFAPGRPGADAHWMTAAKDAVGTSTSLDSKVWFTLADGVMSEVFYPSVDCANLQALQFVIVGPVAEGAVSESRDMEHRIEVLDPHALSFRQINTTFNHSYTITKTYTVDPERNTILINVGVSSSSKAPFAVYVYADPSIANSGMHDTSESIDGAFIASEGNIASALIADCGFTERLVVFWSNHFCISANKGELARIWAGSFEREAIRPHVLGRFADMLKAAEQHPAMLFFLDNQQSLGPDSRAGINRNRGLNENLAREIMELHTLGVGGGYSQDDVTSLARIITGWTYAGRQGQLGAPGTFVFNANAHQPGAQRVMGKIYEANGVAQGEAVLADIARHPATAKFIASKFVRHFIADDPPPALVARLADVFIKSDGDLKALATALTDSDEAWKTPLTKVRSPYEFLVATGRLLAQIPGDPGRYLNGLNVLGQPLWSPAGPNGFPDTNAAWVAPEGMKLRLDISAQIASRLADSIDPRDLLELAAADAASPETRRTVERAESRQQALALLLMSPEFQRR